MYNEVLITMTSSIFVLFSAYTVLLHISAFWKPVYPLLPSSNVDEIFPRPFLPLEELTIFSLCPLSTLHMDILFFQDRIVAAFKTI